MKKINILAIIVLSLLSISCKKDRHIDYGVGLIWEYDNQSSYSISFRLKHGYIYEVPSGTFIKIDMVSGEITDPEQVVYDVHSAEKVGRVKDASEQIVAVFSLADPTLYSYTKIEKYLSYMSMTITDELVEEWKAEMGDDVQPVD